MPYQVRDSWLMSQSLQQGAGGASSGWQPVTADDSRAGVPGKVFLSLMSRSPTNFIDAASAMPLA
jgi:hypothetical protein